jgi:hypothetical protein
MLRARDGRAARFNSIYRVFGVIPGDPSPGYFQDWRPAMEHVGIDVHEVQSQVCIISEAGVLIERRIRRERERFAAILPAGMRAQILIEAVED